MRFCPSYAARRALVALAFLGLLGPAAEGQDRHDWQSLARLHAGDKVRLYLKTGPVDGEFQTWTPQQVTTGGVTARKEDVFKLERYRRGGMGRGKHAAIGAAIGFGGGFAAGAAATGCGENLLGLCVSRGVGGAVGGVVGAVIGASIGALLPHHGRELIFSAK
jgi:hypothetical protein